MSQKIIYQNKSKQVLEIENEGHTNISLRYLNDNVLILPYSLQENEQIDLVGIMYEMNYSRDNEYFKTVISGTMEEGETSLQTAIRELKEETGYFVPDVKKWTYLGELTGSKSVDCFHPCYCVDITGIEIGKRTTDGTVREKNSKFMMIKPNELMKLEDSFLLALYLKLFMYTYSGLF